MPPLPILVRAAVVGVIATAGIAGIASIPHCEPAGFLLLPGALLGALAFPQGIEGDHAVVYFVLAGVLDATLYGLISLAFFRYRNRKQSLIHSSIAIAFVILISAVGCHSAPTPAATQPTTTSSTPRYPPRPAITPPPFRVFQTTDNSITLVTSDNATDDQIAAILYQLHDAAHNHSFAALHIPQQLIDKRDPMVWFHIYRGAKCASEKYTTGKLPCGASYHAAGDYTLGSFSNKDRDDAVLLHGDDKQTELWNPDDPNIAP